MQSLIFFSYFQMTKAFFLHLIPKCRESGRCLQNDGQIFFSRRNSSFGESGVQS